MDHPQQTMLIPELSSKHLAWRNHPEVRKWCRRSHPISEMEMNSWYDKVTTDSSCLYLGILGRFGNVGTAGLSKIDYINGTAEFNLLIDPERQKQGFGKEGLILLLKLAFNDLRLRLIWGEVMEENPALEMFQKVGFQVDGSLRARYFKSGSLVSSTIISITRADAKQQPWWE